MNSQKITKKHKNLQKITKKSQKIVVFFFVNFCDFVKVCNFVFVRFVPRIFTNNWP
jgi:hypothetical protein